MPAAQINLLQGHPRDRLRQLIADVSDAMARILDAPKERLEVWVTEVDPELWGICGEPAREVLQRQPREQVEMPFVQMVLLAGRPKEQHHAVIAELTAIIERVLGTAPGRTRIQIAEVAPDSWGIGGRPAAVVRAAEIEARAAKSGLSTVRSGSMATGGSYDALLLDIGDVIVGVPWQALDAFEAATGLSVPGRGPYDADGDPRWQRRLAGELTGEGYWDEVARSIGIDGWRALFRAVAAVVPDKMFDQEALALMRDARAAGHRVGVLSNDAYSINGPEFFRNRPEFANLDAFVDSTDVGARKPAPEAYLAAAKALDVEPERIVFLDDTPECVEGARAVAMAGIHVDPLDRGPAFAHARRLLALGPETRPERLVRQAEDAYGAQDLDAIMGLFHPDVIVYWNGEKVATGLEETRQFHHDRLGFGAPNRHDYRLTKTLRAAEGDTICVEWASRYRTDDGQAVQGRGGEFWTMRGDLLVEWRAFYHRTPTP